MRRIWIGIDKDLEPVGIEQLQHEDPYPALEAFAKDITVFLGGVFPPLTSRDLFELKLYRTSGSQWYAGKSFSYALCFDYSLAEKLLDVHSEMYMSNSEFHQTLMHFQADTISTLVTADSESSLLSKALPQWTGNLKVATLNSMEIWQLIRSHTSLYRMLKPDFSMDMLSGVIVVGADTTPGFPSHLAGGGATFRIETAEEAESIAERFGDFKCPSHRDYDPDYDPRWLVIACFETQKQADISLRALKNMPVRFKLVVAVPPSVTCPPALFEYLNISQFTIRFRNGLCLYSILEVEIAYDITLKRIRR